MNWVVHRKATPTSTETRVANGPNTTKVRNLTVSAHPTVSNPHAPVVLLYSERVTGPEEVVVTYEQREYMKRWNPLIIPAAFAIVALFPILKALFYAVGGPKKPYYNEHVSEYGCPDIYLGILYGFVGHEPCGGDRGGPKYKNLPQAEETHQTGRSTVEERRPLPRQLVQVTVVAQGAQWQKNTALTVLTDAEGQESIPLDSVFKEFPHAPLEVTVSLTADEAHTTVHLDSHACEAIYTHVRK